MSTTEQSIYNEVFISYSRKNVEFTRKLVEAIYDHGRANVWVDWEDIEYAEDWWQKIQHGIDSAENFLFVLTPDSVRSRVCHDEVDYAVKSGKRIIPLAYIPISEKADFEAMHPAISQHNWLPFSEDDDFEDGMRELLKTLDTDLAHVRFHTRLQTRAREWEQSGNKSAYLLSTGELEEAEAWLTSFAREEKYPLATDLQRDYISESSRVETERREHQRKLEERARRNRLYLFAAIPSVIGLIITSIFAFFEYTRSVQAEQERQVAVRERETAEREAEVVNSIGLATFARFWGRDSNEPLLGLSYALEANMIDNPPIEAQVTLAEIAWQPGARRQFTGHLGEVWGVAYSPDGRYVYSGAGSFTGLPDNRLVQWDAETGEILREFDGHTDRIYSVDVSPDGRYIATGSQDTNIIIWDAETGEMLHLLGDGIREHGVPIFNVMFTNDSTRLITGGRDRIIVWNVETGNIVNRFDHIHGDDHILDMDITDDDRMVFSGSFDNTVRYWELETGTIIHEMTAGQITGARFLPDEARAVTSDQSGDIIIWNLTTGEAERVIEYDEAPLRGGLVVTPDGRRIVVGDDNGNVMIWEVRGVGNAPLYTFRGHDSRVTSLDLHPNGAEVASVSFDRTAIVWDIFGRGAELRRFEDQTGFYAAVQSPDGTVIASGGADGRLLLWDRSSGALLQDIQTEHGSIYDLAFNTNGSRLAMATEDGVVILWDTANWSVVETFLELNAPARNVTFSPDGQLLATAGGQVQVSNSRPLDNRIVIWNMDGELVQAMDGHDAAVRALIFTPDGSAILSGSDDQQIILWDVESGEVVRTYSGHRDAVWSLSFNTDGTQFLSGSRDTDVIQWETESAEIIQRLVGHTSGVRALALHPDGTHAVSGAGSIDTARTTRDFELLYWDLATGSVLRQMPGHQDTVRSLNFVADGEQILSSSDDGAVILWYADTLETLKERVMASFQLVCLPEDPDCDDETQDVVVDEAQLPELSTGFPLQSADVEPYVADSLCLVPTPREDLLPLPTGEVDTAPFMQEGPYVIGYSHGSIDGTSDDWIAAWAAYEASQQENIENFVIRNANSNAPQQVRDLQVLLDSGADVLIINPIERPDSNLADLQEEIVEIVASGVPVVLVGNRTFDAVYTAYVGHDPYEIGCVMAQELVALTDGEGSIGIINGYDLSVADVEFKAAKQAVFDDYAGVLLTVEGPTNYARHIAFTLTSRQEIVGVMGYVSEITLGAQDGLASQALDYVPFVSDHAVDLAQFALMNDIEGVFVSSTTQMGAEAVRTALAILQGQTVSQFVRIPPMLIHSSELDADVLVDAPENGYLGDWETLPAEFYPGNDDSP
ncbi:MAG: TIR domain-containing protein [Anaerolineae bacterium]